MIAPSWLESFWTSSTTSLILPWYFLTGRVWQDRRICSLESCVPSWSKEITRRSFNACSSSEALANNTSGWTAAILPAWRSSNIPWLLETHWSIANFKSLGSSNTIRKSAAKSKSVRSKGTVKGSKYSQPWKNSPLRARASWWAKNSSYLSESQTCSAFSLHCCNKFWSMSSSRIGTRDNLCKGPIDRCDLIENSRRDSISSPKNSRRTGFSELGGNTSTIPPRVENEPTLVTGSSRT